MLSLRRWDVIPDDTRDYPLASTHTQIHMYSCPSHIPAHTGIYIQMHICREKNSRHEKAGVAVLMSDKINTKSNGMNRNKEGYLFICLTRKCVWRPPPPKLRSPILLLIEVLNATRKGHQKVSYRNWGAPHLYGKGGVHWLFFPSHHLPGSQSLLVIHCD